MNALAREIAELIRSEGPMTVARFMALALTHPVHGYYTTREPFGASGDFMTAPEISQMFGELIGLWAADTWTRMGAPDPVRLVELGPGRGTLMADALRAARALPPFRQAIDVDLVEVSPRLVEAQRKTLTGCDRPVAWRPSLNEIPAGPAIVIANEFFDALPIRQFVRTAEGWRERLVGLGPDGALAFGLAPDPEGGDLGPAPEGAVFELAEEARLVARMLGRRLVQHGGAALVIDYGHVRSGFGDTLQGVRSHGFSDPLARPGETDVTAHVDLAALGRAATSGGARLHGPTTQGAFLRALGLANRAERLQARAVPDVVATIDSAVARLAGAGASGMGELFKVMALSNPTLAELAGLPTEPQTSLPIGSAPC